MVLGLVLLLLRVLGVRCPSDLSELQPLFLVNPFSLDQYLDVLSRRRQDTKVSFGVETCMIVERSWIDWSRVAGYRQRLWLGTAKSTSNMYRVAEICPASPEP